MGSFHGLEPRPSLPLDASRYDCKLQNPAAVLVSRTAMDLKPRLASPRLSNTAANVGLPPVSIKRPRVLRRSLECGVDRVFGNSLQ